MHHKVLCVVGPKGTMSQAELHLMRQGLLARARRGELALLPPLGYVRRSDGELVLDPDEQVQQVVRLIFRTFAELGTVNAVLRYLVAHQIQIGLREPTGPARGEVVWRRISRRSGRPPPPRRPTAKPSCGKWSVAVSVNTFLVSAIAKELGRREAAR
jgi:hypothetical protein